MLGPDRDYGAADLGEIGATLRRRSWLVLATTLVALALAFTYLAVAKTKYLATNETLIDARVRPPLASATQPTPVSPDLALIDSQIKVITSESVLRRVAQAERLDRDPEFVPTSPGLRMRLMQLIGLGAKPAAGDADLTLRATMALGEAVSVRRTERTYVIDIDVTTTSPEKSARLANAIAKAYIDDLEANRAAQAQRNADAIRSRLAGLSRKVEETEIRLADARAAAGLFDVNGKSANQTDLGEINQQITALRARAADAKIRFEQIRRLAQEGLTPDGLIEATRSATLEKLRGQLNEIQRQESNYAKTLGPRHPAYLEVRQQIADTKAAIRAEARRLTEVARADYLSAHAQEQAALSRLGGSKQRNEVDEKTMVHLRELDRDAGAARAAYERFLRASETVAEDTPDTVSARVISPAIAPIAPSSPKKFATLAIALVAGLGLGVALALLADLASGKRRAPPAPAFEEAAAAYDDEAPSPSTRPAPRRAGMIAPQLAPDEDVETAAIAPAPRYKSAPAPIAEAPQAAPARRAVETMLIDLAAFEREAKGEAGVRADRARRRAETQLQRMIDEAGVGFGAGLARIAVLEASAHPREGLSTRVAVALARAACARGERALVACARESGALDEAFAQGLPFTVDLDGETRHVAEIEDAYGVVHIAAPDEASARERRAAGLGPASEAFDLVIYDGVPAGFSRSELCVDVDAVFALAGAEDPPERVERARAAIELAGGVFAGALLVDAPSPRTGARSAA